MLTKEQAFKVGFLLRCAQEGLTGEEMAQRIKQAADGVVSSAMDMLGNLGAAALIVPPIAATSVGLLGGTISGGLHGAAKNTMSSAPTPSEDPGQELVDMYQMTKLKQLYERHAERARQRLKHLQQLAAQPRPRSFGI